MEIQITISVRNPDWYWKEDNYQKEWIAINEDKVDKYNPSVTFKVDAEVQHYVKQESDEYTFKIADPAKEITVDVPFKEVTIQGLDVTEFVYADGRTPIVISKSILHNVMAAHNNGKGKFYWYYFIKENADYVKFQDNIWLSQEHANYLEKQYANL
ncbi:hypothetical protein [Pedobacter antarcticus]|uniref:hypothetical protein n=1 Tax=Pedobacter antarcticus TaxID=34086 RepID=UPI00292EC1FE|nr:hypothetical protein [Pedobacter antarcticus]